MSKLIHDKYGKRLFTELFKESFIDKPEKQYFDSKNKEAGSYRIDGILKKEGIAIEIESRASKQVRGALVDLVFHPLNNILLVLIKKYSNDYTTKQCEVILNKLAPTKKIKVIELFGTGDAPEIDKDKKKLKNAIRLLKK